MEDNEILKSLFALQDENYRDFNSKLIPTVDKNNIIGVRTPALRKYAKEIFGTDTAKKFLLTLPHTYYEENNLHGFLIEKIKDLNTAIYEIKRFLPYIDNWATCDCIRPEAIKRDPDRALDYIIEFISSTHTYTIRFGISMLMSFYLDERFKPEFLEIVSKVSSDEYYVNMMVAWYFATALAKQYDKTIVYLEKKRLSDFVHNKTISKACESYRITKEQKSYLKTLR